MSLSSPSREETELSGQKEESGQKYGSDQKTEELGALGNKTRKGVWGKSQPVNISCTKNLNFILQAMGVPEDV